MLGRHVLGIGWHQIGMVCRPVLWNSHTGLGGLASRWRVKWVACFWSHLFCVVEDACFAELFACEVTIAACGGILVAESVGIC